MYSELYEGYEEFQEASMVLDDKIKFRVKDLENKWKDIESKWNDYEEKLKSQKKQVEIKIIDLWKRGYTPEEVEKLLVEEESKSEE